MFKNVKRILCKKTLIDLHYTMAGNRQIGFGVLATGLIIFVSFGIFIILLFTVPSFMPWGMNGVWVQSRFMTYVGDEMPNIFQQRNLIIESSRAEINIRVRKPGFEDEARIQVFENANGISFNSLNRTHIDFMEVLDAYGFPATKILVREPQGLMARTARIYINLRCDSSLPIGQRRSYNFTLNTGSSPVRFSSDTNPTGEFMNIENLTLRGTGQVTLPAPTTQFAVNVENLRIDSPNSRVNFRGTVSGHTVIRGGSQNITLGNINTLDVQGTSHNVILDNAGGHINFNAPRGSIRLNQIGSGDLNVDSENVTVDAGWVHRLNVETNTGRVTVRRVETTSDVTMQSGNLSLGIMGMQQGVQGGVIGNVNVNKDFGGASIIFHPTYAIGNLVVRAHDGEINAQRTRGLVDIQISSMGNANVTVGFSTIVNHSRIMIWGAREPNTQGRINVQLLGNLGADLHIRGTSRITSNLPNSGLHNCSSGTHANLPGQSGLPDYVSGSGCHITVIRGGSDGRILHLRTQGAINIA